LPGGEIQSTKNQHRVRAPYSANVLSLVRTDTFFLRASAMMIRSNGSRWTRGRVAPIWRYQSQWAVELHWVFARLGDEPLGLSGNSTRLRCQCRVISQSLAALNNVHSDLRKTCFQSLNTMCPNAFS
jgi:hypothetical protein